MFAPIAPAYKSTTDMVQKDIYPTQAHKALYHIPATACLLSVQEQNM